MYSRAHLLIEKDYEALIADNLWGIEAHPLTEDSVFTWTATIHGLKQTLWEGGVFRLYVKFDEHYKYRPPVVCFHTIPFHPNIDPITGRPCLDFLDDPDRWEDSYTISFILASIQNLLSNPVLTSAVNNDAVEMIINNPHGYKKMVLDCVLASQRVQAGLDPHHELMYRPEPTGASERPTTKPLNNAIQKLSFNDYHRTWSGIATSKPNAHVSNPLVDMLENDAILGSVHYVLTPDELQAQMARQLESHNALMYGKFTNSKPNKDLEQQAKLAKIEKMRKIYLPQKREPTIVSPKPESTRHVTTAVKNLEDESELFGPEADDLLAWTSKLDVNNL